MYRNVTACWLFKAKKIVIGRDYQYESHIFESWHPFTPRKTHLILAFLSSSSNFPTLHIHWNDLSSPASSYFSHKYIIPKNYSMTSYGYNNLFVYSLYTNKLISEHFPKPNTRPVIYYINDARPNTWQNIGNQFYLRKSTFFNIVKLHSSLWP